VRKEDRRLGIAILVAVILAVALVSWGKQFLGADYRATRSCPESYWTCETKVLGQALLSPEETQLSFMGEARGCFQNGAWESSVRRGRFTCAASGLVTPASCEAMETSCALPGGRLYDL
jgi:hypothetical protein